MTLTPAEIQMLLDALNYRETVKVFQFNEAQEKGSTALAKQLRGELDDMRKLADKLINF